MSLYMPVLQEPRMSSMFSRSFNKVNKNQNRRNATSEIYGYPYICFAVKRGIYLEFVLYATQTTAITPE